MLLTLAVNILSCTRGEIPKAAEPVGARLIEYELVGKVRSVVVESKENQTSTTSQVHYLTTMAFDRNGILQEHSFLKRNDGRITEENAIINILDNKGRLIRTTIQSASNEPELIEYQYSVRERSIILKPTNILLSLV
jgi:regulator of extracellular matrix RemA (YlzA/DUF370 family)